VRDLRDCPDNTARAAVTSLVENAAFERGYAQAIADTRALLEAKGKGVIVHDIIMMDRERKDGGAR